MHESSKAFNYDVVWISLPLIMTEYQKGRGNTNTHIHTKANKEM